MFIAPRPYISANYYIKAAVEPWELNAANEVRRCVFCVEQNLFETDDRDDVDDHAIPLVAISTISGFSDEVAGTVRIHKKGDRIWYGSRLAVLPKYRKVGSIGSELIKLAVSSANGIGCDAFYAHVQIQNEKLFNKLHWNSLDYLEIRGVKHVFMQADLNHYPPFYAPEHGWHISKQENLVS